MDLGKNLGIATIQLKDHMKLKKKEDQSVDFSVLLRRGKTFQEVEDRRELVGVKEGKRGKGGRIRYERRLERCTDGQEIE